MERYNPNQLNQIKHISGMTAGFGMLATSSRRGVAAHSGVSGSIEYVN